MRFSRPPDGWWYYIIGGTMEVFIRNIHFQSWFFFLSVREWWNSSPIATRIFSHFINRFRERFTDWLYKMKCLVANLYASKRAYNSSKYYIFTQRTTNSFTTTRSRLPATSRRTWTAAIVRCATSRTRTAPASPEAPSSPPPSRPPPAPPRLTSTTAWT